LARAGAKVAIFDVNLDQAKVIAEEIGGAAIPCDVTDASSAESAIAVAHEKHGAARVLVNCAGIAPGKRIVGREGPMPLDDFTKVIQVNLIGTFNMMRLAAADMSKLDVIGSSSENAERGVIVSTASVAAYEGQIGQAAYAASKGGVASLTLPAARELAQFGIRVMAIAPGIMLTPMMAGMTEEIQQSLGASVPFPKRMGHPSEYAALVLHIVENGYLNGEVIRLDGALRMPPK
jgi:NAD(P)-dependent dehydrogenase (short-subunit alcohol dehydrogenase family)